MTWVIKFEGAQVLSDDFFVVVKKYQKEKIEILSDLVGTSPTRSKSHVPLVFSGGPAIKFMYSEKATKFCEIFPLLLTVCIVVKSTEKISQNFVAFSEYMNFNLSRDGFYVLKYIYMCKKSYTIPFIESKPFKCS